MEFGWTVWRTIKDLQRCEVWGSWFRSKACLDNSSAIHVGRLMSPIYQGICVVFRHFLEYFLCTRYHKIYHCMGTITSTAFAVQVVLDASPLLNQCHSVTSYNWCRIDRAIHTRVSPVSYNKTSLANSAKDTCAILFSQGMLLASFKCHYLNSCENVYGVVPQIRSI